MFDETGELQQLTIEHLGSFTKNYLFFSRAGNCVVTPGGFHEDWLAVFLQMVFLSVAPTD